MDQSPGLLRILWVKPRTNVIIQQQYIQPKKRLLPTIQPAVTKVAGPYLTKNDIEKLLIQGKVERKKGRCSGSRCMALYKVG